MPNLEHFAQKRNFSARCELKKQTATLQKASAEQRRAIASLKRQVADLERAAKIASKRSQKAAVLPEAATSEGSLRFRADGFKTLRKKLGLSAEQAAKLIGVSGQSIYAWETKRSAPRKSQLPAIAALRKLGKREAHARLDALSDA